MVHYSSVFTSPGSSLPRNAPTTTPPSRPGSTGIPLPPLQPPIPSLPDRLVRALALPWGMEILLEPQRPAPAVVVESPDAAVDLDGLVAGIRAADDPGSDASMNDCGDGLHFPTFLRSTSSSKSRSSPSARSRYSSAFMAKTAS